MTTIYVDDVEKLEEMIKAGIKKAKEEDYVSFDGKVASIIEFKDVVDEITVYEEDMSITQTAPFGTIINYLPLTNCLEDILSAAIKKIKRINDLIETLK